jgi:hypothetical protein
VFEEARERIYRLGPELLSLGRLSRGEEAGEDGGEGVEGEVLRFCPRRKVRYTAASISMYALVWNKREGTHGFLCGGIVLHSCADDPQCLHSYVV